VNQNGGRTQVITAPHPEAQEEIVFDACAEAGIEPKDLDFVECHGTGTRIGDPIEVSALRNTVARGRAGVCWLGSVKSNIGHLESAAGIAGLIKAVLALCHGEIPPNLHFDTPNRFIDFAGGRLQVVTQSTPISRTALVGVSSFGFGGVNAHVVLAGVEDAVRKPVVDVPMPFDRARARPLTAYYTLGGEPPQGPGAGNADAAAASGPVDIRALVEQAFTSVTRIKDIDPSVPLTDQGLDSLGTAQFATMLQQRLGVEVSTDLLFDYPLVEDLVAALETLRAG
jgi:acyl transferase domain-containing protein